uniref:hypothetical protein n=1 Tax=Ndongobacter massiliensis TaxID=1871025 RepID=UPI00092FDC8F|nr:hypothetical protein [Ndongobacter massiliensis]
MKKRIFITLAVFCFLAFGYVIHEYIKPSEYIPTQDEIALKIQFNVKEDIGLLVFDYVVNGHEFSSGIANTDRSLIKHDEQIIHVWNKEELQAGSGPLDLSIKFRIITEYMDPNFENSYPEELTKVLEPIFWKAEFGKMYEIIISGDKINGYTAGLKYKLHKD